MTGRARYDALPGTIQRILDNPNASPEDLAQARADCRNMSSSQQVSVSGVMCVARISLIEARRSEGRRRENYGDARCAAHRASRVARNNPTVRREADGYWAEALVGLLSMGAGDPAVYDRELTNVHVAQASAVVHRAITDRYLNQNRVDLARNEVNAHLRSNDRDRALALISIARHQDRSGASDAVVRQTLEEAYQADRTSLAANSALGSAYFDMGHNYWGTAEPYLRTATLINPPPVGEENLQEQANYYLSVIEADRGNLPAARAYADSAGNEARALRQACLVRLLQGGNAVYNWVQGQEVSGQTEGEQRCRQPGATPEGQLLLGMFWLRRAQFVAQAYRLTGGVLADPGRQKWDYAVQQARNAFFAGDRALTNDRAELNWPGHGDDVTLRQMIDYANELRDYYGARCERSEEPLPDPRAVPVERVFEYYKIVRPRGSPLRCMPG
ncbi:MAG: hypothetical protein ACT4OF_13245 [Caulobacteraceae bacterium]